jgi:hypothetical protein
LDITPRVVDLGHDATLKVDDRDALWAALFSGFAE